MELHQTPVHQLAGLLRTRQLGARELVQVYLDRINRLAGDLNCFITITEEKALKQADLAQQRLDDGTAGPLTGIPMALKDNLDRKSVV